MRTSLILASFSEELRIKKEWQLKKANEQNQIDKDDWSKPVDLNEYGISFKRVKYRKWKKALKKEKIRDQMFRRTSGDHHALSKEVNGVMKYLTRHLFFVVGFLFSCEFFVSLHWHWHLLVLLWEQDQIFLIYEFLH
jgi:hypothetical protein